MPLSPQHSLADVPPEPGFPLITEGMPATSVFARLDGLREQYPAFHSDDRPGFWTLTRYADIDIVLRDTNTFTSRSVFVGNPDIRGRWWPVMLDPPEHAPWRRLITPYFTPRAVEGMTDWVTSRCESIVSSLAAQGSCDFVSEFSLRFPTGVFAQLMGFPERDTDQIYRWQQKIERPGTGPDRQHQVAEGALSLAGYFADLIAQRRSAPGDDLISAALNWQMDGEPVSDDDIISLCAMLCSPGFSTVPAQLSYIFRHLATHEDDRQRLIADPALVPAAVEEFLRLYPVGMIGRKLARATDRGGCPMQAGDMVMLAVPAANRDPRAFPDPLSFRPDRPETGHLAFGAGVHYCLGARLARLELRVAIEQWHRLIPDYRIAAGADLTEHQSQTIWLDSLPLTWSPRPA
jgi:cytochrome P450